jgi:hypothetical protein
VRFWWINFAQLGAILMLLLGLVDVASAQVNWLDGDLSSWNAPGMAVQAAPEEALVGQEFCREMLRIPETEEDFQVANQGWLLFAPYQLNEGISIVHGLLRMDANCRPAAFQAFVFVDGVFAGTLSPELMAARGDGSLFDASVGSGGVSALYDRYLPTDGLCCPSGQTQVWFAVEWTDAGPVVTPTQAEQLPAPPPGR